MANDDFDLNAIPPVEIGLSALHHPEEEQGCGGDSYDDCGESFGTMVEEDEYNDHTPGGHDPFASLFSYDSMSW